MRVTVAMLKHAGACVAQWKLFEQLFPDGVDVTEELCVAHADKFDWGWAAANLLPSPLYADYDAKRAPLYADYDAKLAALYADYNAKRAPLYADYDAKLAALYADYNAKRAALYADYNAKRAPLFGQLANYRR